MLSSNMEPMKNKYKKSGTTISPVAYGRLLRELERKGEEKSETKRRKTIRAQVCYN